ncbi:hypothetical protein HID58_066533 [Brassica napus]|uniref:Zinc knuckle CX2CX4HX4C domain-containing protein n=1 Tax=Brassica napus TaxID=3708 RepID=A0ABQ7ZFY2_BRANA|nr:hypothetical protein HID58_066533 [Brassica napus]
MSEYEASMCFSEHGGTLLMSWRSWTEPWRRVVDVLQLAYIIIWQKKSLDLEAGSRRQDPDPGAGPWKRSRPVDDPDQGFSIVLSVSYKAISLVCLSRSSPRIHPLVIHADLSLLIGFPLHLWTDANLRNIGGRIGHVDTLELTEGRMLIDVDSRRPLKFSRKVEYEGDEVTIEIKYDKLFKHCTTCGLLSHEKGYCPNVDVRSRLQHVERPVFSRLQQNQDVSRQNWGRDALANTRATQQSSLQSRGIQSSQYYTSKPLRSDDMSTLGQAARYWEDDSSRGRHSDRIIRSRDDHSRRSRYGGARGAGPYARPKTTPKLHDRLGRNQIEGDSATNAGSTSREIVPYERSPTTTSPTNAGLAETRSGERLTYRKLASTIVTPVRAEQPMENNVTLRGKGEARTIVFSPSGSAETSHPDDLIIGALSDMELMDQSEGALAADGADGDDGDDLLELDLMVLEESKSQPRPIEDSGRSSLRATRSKKPGVRSNTPLGIKNRKFEGISK